MATDKEASTGGRAGAADGLGPEDLMAVRRALFMDALAVARHDHHPSREWDAFAETAWREAALAFGFVERERWREGLEAQQPPAGSSFRSQNDRDDAS